MLWEDSIIEVIAWELDKKNHYKSHPVSDKYFTEITWKLNAELWRKCIMNPNLIWSNFHILESKLTKYNCI